MPDRDAEDLDLLTQAVHEAGGIARKFFGGTYKRWNKAGGSPVTEADLAIDAFLKQALLAARPDYGWLSEESIDDPARLKAERVFVVDPIDGTVAFLKGRPHFTICAAVVEAGRPRAGVVDNPVAGECFAARRGAGASCNGVPIHAGDRDSIEGCRMLGNAGFFATGWPAMQIASYSSIAYRVALVAMGRHDAMLSLSAKRDWDLAAADLILQEAGGVISDDAGRPLVYNRPAATQRAVAAAGPILHRLLLDYLRQKEGLEGNPNPA